MHNSLEQFKINKLFSLSFSGIDLSFTNSSFFMLLALVIIVAIAITGVRRTHLIPSRLQSFNEMIYELVNDMVIDNAGVEATKYVPFIFTVFVFVLVCNLLGMLPYAFTVTSHIAVTFALAGVIFIGITIIGFVNHGLHFLKLFLPHGTPLIMAPLMIVIEVFTYFIRPVSLSIRLAANMTAGHLVMKVIASLVIMAGLFGIFPFIILLALVGFEFFVAGLQAYIFTILACVYLSDAIKLH